MNVVMLTNTYLPHVGGVARSVSTCQAALERRGHLVRIVAPQFAGALESTGEVLRLAAVQNFNGSDFSVTIPQPGVVADFLDRVQPDLLHSHHPFLLGDTALRAAWTRRLPVVFTHHTLYEQYTHYVPLDSAALQRAVVQMVTEYCNLCTHVIAPSGSIAALLAERGVTTPVSVIPTGIELARFGEGNGAEFRRRRQLPSEALVVGHVGRLAAEKNLDYLARAVGLFLAERPEAVFVVAGDGESAAALQQTVAELASPGQIRMLGTQTGQDLLAAYAAMDAFVFSSHSETQGLVLVEAMAARTAVLALDASGARDVVTEANGRLLPADAPPEEFAAALAEMTNDRESLRRLGQSARDSVRDYDVSVCAGRLEGLYEQLVAVSSDRPDADWTPWDRLLRRLEIEWNLVVEKAAAVRAAVADLGPAAAPAEPV